MPAAVPPRPGEHRADVVLFGVTLLLVVGVVHGWRGFGCYFIQEHHRLLWWETVLMWTGDALALFWYLQFCGRWLLGRIDLTAAALPRGGMPRSVWWVLGSLLLGMTAEFVLALKITFDEYNGFQRAVAGVCNVTNIKRLHPNADPWQYQLTGTYRDAAGLVHLATYRLRPVEELGRLPPGVVQAIQQGQPFPLPIVIDPQRPGRHWVREFGWDDPNRLHYVSFLVLLFQLVFGFAAAHQVYESIRVHRRRPWWAELHKVFPLCCEAFVFALFGGMECYLMHRMCP